MKIHFWAIALLTVTGLLTPACSTIKEVGKIESFPAFRGFNPIDPMELSSKIQLFNDKDSVPVHRDVRSLSKEEVLRFLANESVLTTISQVDVNGDLKAGPGTFSTKNSKYRITMDYMKYSTLMIGDTANRRDGFARVGVGLRVILSVFASKSNIALTDLFSIGFAAEAGHLSGSLMIEIIGLKSNEVTSAIPLPSEINPTTIQLVMSSMATIKSKVYDPQTELIPQIVAIQSGDDAFRSDMLRHFTDYQYKAGYVKDGLTTKDSIPAPVYKKW